MPLYPVASVDNAMTLLELLSRRAPLRLVDAARELDVAPSTAHRLLAMLEHRGFARRRPGSRAYVAGPAFYAAARDVLSEVDLGRVAQPMLDELGHACHESVLLGTLSSDGVRFIAGFESEQQLRVGGHFGHAFVPHTSASGLVLLASLSTTQLIERYPMDRIPSMSRLTDMRRTQLERELAKVRTQRYALVVDTTAIGVGAVAVPVTGSDGETLAAVTLIAPTARYTIDTLRGSVRSLEKLASRLRAALT